MPSPASGDLVGIGLKVADLHQLLTGCIKQSFPCGTVGSDIDRVVPKTRHRCIVPQLVINLSPIKVFGKECIRDDAW